MAPSWRKPGDLGRTILITTLDVFPEDEVIWEEVRWVLELVTLTTRGDRKERKACHYFFRPQIFCWKPISWWLSITNHSHCMAGWKGLVLSLVEKWGGDHWQGQWSTYIFKELLPAGVTDWLHNSTWEKV